MDRFAEALCFQEQAPIPPEDDWFAPLIGDWRFDYADCGGRRLQGEWYFRKVLDGVGVEDVFICPSRATRHEQPQPDGEYGVALRMYNPSKRCYDMMYTCDHKMNHLEVRREGGSIVCTVLENPSNQWVFCEVGERTFHWQNITRHEDGTRFVNCEVFATRLD